VDDVAPTFTWSRENDDANDSFKIYIFNEDYSERIFATGIAVAGDVTSYTLSAAEWDILKNSGLGEYLFVVAGSDTTTYTSGEYWSGGKSFELVPEPGLSALLAFALARAAWRRRGGPGTATL